MSRVPEAAGFDVLAAAGSWTVSSCPRGCVHVGLGPWSLRLSPSQFDRFVEMVVEASVRRGVREAVARWLPRS